MGPAHDKYVGIDGVYDRDVGSNCKITRHGVGENRCAADGGDLKQFNPALSRRGVGDRIPVPAYNCIRVHGSQQVAGRI